ncbi:MAG TPA: hypothetical protein VLE69_01475 [Candidatus Saccharimonadales bacterium]|nr:hypothetical protein [Candidatus Saccharimonadales bacterium]
MSDNFEISGSNGQSYRVDVLDKGRDARNFGILSIPLLCTVRRESRDDYPRLRYVVEAPDPIVVPTEVLFGSEEFDTALEDEEMPTHANRVLSTWLIQSELIQSN